MNNARRRSDIITAQQQTTYLLKRDSGLLIDERERNRVTLSTMPNRGPFEHDADQVILNGNCRDVFRDRRGSFACDFAAGHNGHHAFYDSTRAIVWDVNGKEIGKATTAAEPLPNLTPAPKVKAALPAAGTRFVGANLADRSDRVIERVENGCAYAEDGGMFYADSWAKCVAGGLIHTIRPPAKPTAAEEVPGPCEPVVGMVVQGRYSVFTVEASYVSAWGGSAQWREYIASGRMKVLHVPRKLPIVGLHFTDRDTAKEREIVVHAGPLAVTLDGHSYTAADFTEAVRSGAVTGLRMGGVG